MLPWTEKYHELNRIDRDDCPLDGCPFTTLELEPRQLLYDAGARADAIYLVRKGIVGLSADREGAVESIRMPGSFVGLECLTGPRYQSVARALAETSLALVTKPALLKWLVDGDDRHLQRILYEALRDANVVMQLDAQD